MRSPVLVTTGTLVTAGSCRVVRWRESLELTPMRSTLRYRLSGYKSPQFVGINFGHNGSHEAIAGFRVVGEELVRRKCGLGVSWLTNLSFSHVVMYETC
jgi:hypothetical protein